MSNAARDEARRQVEQEWPAYEAEILAEYPPELHEGIRESLVPYREKLIDQVVEIIRDGLERFDGFASRVLESAPAADRRWAQEAHDRNRRALVVEMLRDIPSAMRQAVSTRARGRMPRYGLPYAPGARNRRSPQSRRGPPDDEGDEADPDPPNAGPRGGAA
jgi:hypothetical protein